jgi:hypothetical protein
VLLQKTAAGHGVQPSRRRAGWSRGVEDIDRLPDPHTSRRVSISTAVRR